MTSKLGALIKELYSHDKLPHTPQECALLEDRTSRALRADLEAIALAREGSNSHEEKIEALSDVVSELMSYFIEARKSQS